MVRRRCDPKRHRPVELPRRGCRLHVSPWRAFVGLELYMFCPGNLLGGLWLGGSDLDGRGDWTWIDGTVFWVARTSGRPPVNRYTNWETGEPRNAEIRQDCLLAANS